MSSVDKFSRVPLYYQLAEEIKNSIKQGNLCPGARIPSEDELCKLHGVSRTTVRAAVQFLVDQGYLYKSRGVGTVVTRQHLRREGWELTGFTEDVKRLGRLPGSRLIDLKLQLPPHWVQEALNLSKGEKTLVFTRVRLVDGDPVAVHTCHLSPRLGLELEELKGVDSLYQFLEEKGVRIIQAEELLEARAISPALAPWLGVKKNAPVLVVKRTSFDEHGTPVECVEGVYRSDRYQHYLLLQSRSDGGHLYR